MCSVCGICVLCVCIVIRVRMIGVCMACAFGYIYNVCAVTLWWICILVYMLGSWVWYLWNMSVVCELCVVCGVKLWCICGVCGSYSMVVWNINSVHVLMCNYCVCVGSEWCVICVYGAFFCMLYVWKITGNWYAFMKYELCVVCVCWVHMRYMCYVLWWRCGVVCVSVM